MTDPDRTFVHLGHGSLFGGNVSGGNDAVRFFASGDMDNETGPIQMQNFELARFDSAHVAVRDEWFHPEAQQRASFRGNLSAALSPKFDLSVSSGFSKLDNRIPPESDLIIALYYVGMQNYGYKGCPGGKLPVRSRQGSIPGRRRAAQRRAAVGARRRHAGHAEFGRAAVHGQLHRHVAPALLDAERRHGRP